MPRIFDLPISVEGGQDELLNGFGHLGFQVLRQMTGQSSSPSTFQQPGMSRGRSESPHRLGNSHDEDEEMRSVSRSSLPRDRDAAKPGPKVVIVLNLTRNVADAHLRAIFGLYGEIRKVDLPVHARCTSFLRGSYNRHAENPHYSEAKSGEGCY